MMFNTLTGRQKPLNIGKYLVDWDGECLSKFQFNVKQFLRPFWLTKLVCEEAPVVATRMRIDFLNITDKIAVEVNGAQHSAVSNHFHGGSLALFRDQLKRDIKKQKYCDINGIILVEINPKDKLSVEWFKEKYDITL